VTGVRRAVVWKLLPYNTTTGRQYRCAHCIVITVVAGAWGIVSFSLFWAKICINFLRLKRPFKIPIYALFCPHCL